MIYFVLAPIVFKVFKNQFYKIDDSEININNNNSFKIDSCKESSYKIITKHLN